jgi:hypothetical protein
MDQSDCSCPQCGARYDLDQPPPARCLKCGADLPAPRRTWRRYFWLLFFLTPVFTLAAGWMTVGPLSRFVPRGLLPQGLHFLGSLPQLAGPAVLLVGAWGAGYFLAKSHFRTTRTTAAFITASIVYAVGILFVYGAIFFVGCLVVMGALKNV